MNAQLQNLKTLPRRMQFLPVDSDRGFVVPWFVAWVNGKPEFRAMDPQKFARAIKEKLCWVCGKRLGVNMCFVAGPMCGINRTSAEPPSHLDCALWSVRNCPFMNNPRMVRREDDVINNANFVENAAGCAITRNPGVMMLWITRSYEWFRDGNQKILISMGTPESVEWFTCGRTATRAEVEAAIDSGLPILEEMARQEKGSMEFLQKSIDRFQKWIPA
jgi:hypothetical protein